MMITGAVAWWPPIYLDEFGCVEIQKKKTVPDVLPQYKLEPPEEPPKGTCWWYVSPSEWANTNWLFTCIQQDPRQEKESLSTEFPAHTGVYRNGKEAVGGVQV